MTPISQNGEPAGSPFQLGEKNFRQAAASFSALKKYRKTLIENERHPSWVSFVTIFLPGELVFRVY